MKQWCRRKIAVYGQDGKIAEHITRMVYEFKRHQNTYFGVNYCNKREEVKGSDEHPNGMYICPNRLSGADEKAIHIQHVYDEREIVSINKG